MKILVTGGAGFIGSAVVRTAVERGFDVVNLDKLTYAANLDNVKDLAPARHAFEQVDICDRAALDEVFRRHQPDTVMHLAAESHVDRSIDGPSDFIETNIVGTYTLLEASRAYLAALDSARAAAFRVHHVSTDEVYGTLGDTGQFTEETAYRPNSPYSASKASSDMLVRAWGETFSLPVVISNCSNNYGPYQFPEKLVPVVILNALAGEPIPVYGKGMNIRDWLYVEDHADALLTILTRGELGETYNVGGNNEVKNIELVRTICAILDEISPPASGQYEDQITHVTDRPGHDFRYAIDATKIKRELGWEPRVTVEQGLRQTVQWYLDNAWWWQAVEARNGTARKRLGLSVPERAK